jgi:hypothetical protein
MLLDALEGSSDKYQKAKSHLEGLSKCLPQEQRKPLFLIPQNPSCGEIGSIYLPEVLIGSNGLPKVQFIIVTPHNIFHN